MSFYAFPSFFQIAPVLFFFFILFSFFMLFGNEEILYMNFLGRLGSILNRTVAYLPFLQITVLFNVLRILTFFKRALAVNFVQDFFFLKPHMINTLPVQIDNSAT